MKTTAAVLTWNPISNHRLELLAATVESLQTADRVVVFNNGSTDGFKAADHYPDTVDVPALPGFPPGNTCGYGMNKIAATIQSDLVIMSNDDITWRPDAIPTLKAVWKEAPPNMAVLSGLVEPTFALPDTEPWNQPLDTLEVAGHKLLARKSVPGGAWTYKKPQLLFPVSTFPGVDDVPACHKLNQAGYVTACMELADHVGVGVSTWGNASHDRFVVAGLDEVKAEYGL